MLAVVGHTTRDLVDDFDPRPGGPPLYAARALRALGEPGLIVTRCAADDEELLEPLRAEAPELVWRAGDASPTFRLRYRGTVREAAIEALGEPWLVADMDGWLGDALARADWVHAAALWRGEFPPETLARLASGRRLALEGHGLVRPGTLGQVVPDADFDRAVLEHVSVLHLSENEARVLGVELEAGAPSRLGVPEVVVTLGDRGSAVLADGELHRVSAEPVAGVDPTGAGDGFIAVYLARRRAGDPPVAAAERATTVLRELLARAKP
jgi:sugar/nucleoside kinase (ribokinase family)